MGQTVNETLTCALVEERALVERYVAETLTDKHGRADFEAHVIACPRCQDEIRLATAIRIELARPASARRPIPWLPLGLVAAAVLGGVVLLRPAGERTALAQLGAVAQPPIYLGQAVRGAATPADSIFAAAMAAYDDRRYGEATAGLARALAAGVDSAPALFFLGASELLTNRPAEAAAAFQRVLALGETPYLPEAHYYRAKALLRLGDGSAGLAELGAVRSKDTPIAGAAAALADSVTRLPQR
jgi:hypothetical protein